MKTSTIGPWTHTPEHYQKQLRELLGTYVQRLQLATGLTLDQIARDRLEWARGNNFTQLTSAKYKSILSPSSSLQMAAALELNEEETDLLIMITMRANSDKTSKLSPHFISRYDKAVFRFTLNKAKKRGISIYA